jgi:RHS repeat-associated protein
MQMQLAFNPVLSQPPLAAMPQLSEKPHLGFASKYPAWNQGPSVCNSTAAIGLRAGLALECVRETRQTGLYYVKARYYNPNLGRFLQTDPSGTQGGFNLYAYAENDPVNLEDHTGMSPDGGGLIIKLSETIPTYFMGVFGVNQATVSATATNCITCTGAARVLKGNAATIGRPGGFSGSSAGNIPVTANGAAIIPSQWGMSKSALRPYINQISGEFRQSVVFLNPTVSFQGVVDIVGGTPPSGYTNVQTGLMALNPGKLIIELPGASQDYGVMAVTLTVPTAVGCPTGTVQVR